MIFLIHGKNELESQKTVSEIHKKFNPQEKIEVDLEELSPAEFAEKTLTPNMFGYKNLLIVEIGKTTNDQLLKHIGIATKAPTETTIIFTTNKKYRSNSKVIKLVKEIKESKIIEVKENRDSTIFNFLDAVFNKERKKAYKLLETLLEKEEPSFKTHSMLVYQLRNIAKTKFGGSVSAPSFVKNKLKKQSNKFSKENILSLYEYFYKTDRDMKLGLIPDNILNIISIEKIMET